jgi:PleD family two-component response regulator
MRREVDPAWKLFARCGPGARGQIKDRQPKRPAAPAASLLPLHGRRILVVDDNETNRKVLMEKLSQFGIEPVSAVSADEALALLRAAHDAEQSFQVALLDDQMPVCDGEELGRMIGTSRRRDWCC